MSISVTNSATHLQSLAAVLMPLLIFVGQNSSCGRSNTNGTRTAVKVNSQNRSRELTGQWGGVDIALEVTSEGININFGCAHGHIDETIIPDSEGNFSVKGTYVREHGGPMRSDDNPDVRNATYKGNIAGEKMTLTVTFPDGTEDVGPFNLEHGKSGRIHKCM